MKFLVFFFVLASGIGLNSCKKPNIELDGEQTVRKNCLLIETSFIQNNTHGKIIYTYDDLKRISNVRFEDGSQTANYVYKTNQIEETITETQGSTINIYNLDANNRVTSIKQSTTIPNKPNTESTLSYDNQGYLIEMVTTDLSNQSKKTEKFAYSLGNLTEYDNGEFRFGIFYETNIPYQESLFMPVYNTGFPKHYFHVLKSYFGKPSVLLATGNAQGSILNNFQIQIDENVNVIQLNFGNIINYVVNQRYSCPQ